MNNEIAFLTRLYSFSPSSESAIETKYINDDDIKTASKTACKDLKTPVNEDIEYTK